MSNALSRLWVFLAFLSIAAPAAAQRLVDSECEQSSLDIFPDQFYACEAMQSWKKGFDKHALDLFKRSAKFGSKSSQYRVGLMYLGGYGTEEDLVEATAWLLLANERNKELSTERLQETLAMLTVAQDQAAKRRALELRKEYGDVAALERRGKWSRRMRARATGSRLGNPMASVRFAGNTGLTGDIQAKRISLYEKQLYDILTTVEYRDFKVLDDAGSATTAEP